MTLLSLMRNWWGDLQICILSYWVGFLEKGVPNAVNLRITVTCWQKLTATWKQEHSAWNNKPHAHFIGWSEKYLNFSFCWSSDKSRLCFFPSSNSDLQSWAQFRHRIASRPLARNVTRPGSFSGTTTTLVAEGAGRARGGGGAAGWGCRGVGSGASAASSTWRCRGRGRAADGPRPSGRWCASWCPAATPPRRRTAPTLWE